jgi:hypothetical protein
MIPMQKIEEVGKKRGKITPPIFSDVVFLWILIIWVFKSLSSFKTVLKLLTGFYWFMNKHVFWNGLLKETGYIHFLCLFLGARTLSYFEHLLQVNFVQWSTQKEHFCQWKQLRPRSALICAWQAAPEGAHLGSAEGIDVLNYKKRTGPR